MGDGKHSGMGALVHEHGVAFRVWAPNAESVHVTGDFTDWDDEAAPLEPEGRGCWYADVAGAVQRFSQLERRALLGDVGHRQRLNAHLRAPSRLLALLCACFGRVHAAATPSVGLGEFDTRLREAHGRVGAQRDHTLLAGGVTVTPDKDNSAARINSHPQAAGFG